jgi:acetylornithine deacetylase/succinyl-diaminopimelate desuccinylase-like protein
MENYIAQHRQRFLDELFELLRLPSVSADPAFTPSVLATAEATARFLREAGAQKVDVCETPGFPVVYGEYMIDASRPTVLVYGHYDVQPADPVELWSSPPFEPEIRSTDIHPGGAIFARGACDDKGQFFMHVKAFEAMVATGNVPCNIKFMIEGEEEV